MSGDDSGRPLSRRGSGSERLTRAMTAPARAMSRIFAGDQAAAPVAEATGGTGVVDCAVYVGGVRQPGEIDYRQALAVARSHDDAFVWLGLHAPTEEQMAGIAEAFGLHELTVEDVVSAGQRPKLEHFGEVQFLVLRAARYIPHPELTATSEVIDTGQVMLLLGPDFVISVRHGDACRLKPVRRKLEAKPDLLRQGPWAVVYGVLDHVVDLYMDAAEGLNSDVDELEESVFARHSRGRMQRIYQLKRELVEFKRAVLPLLRPMSALLQDNQDNQGIPADLHKYFGDVQDHLARVAEQVNYFDDLLISIMQARLAQVAVDQNNDMRKIAAWAGIAAVWTAIAGIYGMNFHDMPETRWRYGYPLVLAVMLAISFVLYRQFRKSKWL